MVNDDEPQDDTAEVNEDGLPEVDVDEEVDEESDDEDETETGGFDEFGKELEE